MIQANELRIGNWYNHNGEYCQVSPNTILEVWESPRKWVQPIPITPEILEKCGFEKKDNGWFKLNICKDYINLYFESLAKAELSISGLGMKMPHIKYLHQLQNIYFALTGEELIYKNC